MGLTGEALAKVDLKYVQVFHDRHGKERVYFRFRGQRTALPSTSDPAFAAAYERCLRQITGDIAAPTNDSETLGWLVTSYQASPEFKRLGDRTRHEYRRILSDICSPVDGMGHGTKKWRHLTYERVLAHVRDPLADTPRKADTYVSVLSAVYSWAVKRRMTKENPCRGIERLYQGGEGYRAWTVREMEAFAKGATEDEYRIFALALYTGQRSGDLCRLTWFQYDGTTIRLTQGKTKAQMIIPVHETLREVLGETRKTNGPILMRQDGKAYNSSSLSKKMTLACKRMQLDGCTLHGLRATHATLIAEGGGSSKVIAASTGHRRLSMVEHYTRGAEQERLAKSGIGLLPNIARTASGNPDNKWQTPPKRNKAPSK